jgi:arginyl-tRNA synthetase
VTDYQQAPHFAVVLHVAGMLQSDWRALSHHVPHGRMSFKGQKMSSRLGGVPLAVEVIDAVLEEVRERSAERSIATSTMDMIAIGAIKYAILRSKPGQNINFDPETSLSFEGDSGPYLQYTHARIATLLEKAEREGVSVGETFGRQCSSDLARALAHFDAVVREARGSMHVAPQPHLVLGYVTEVAQLFNALYAQEVFVASDAQQKSSELLSLAKVTQEVVQVSLYLLGIGAPYKM